MTLPDAYAGNAAIGRDLPPVDPGDGQSERLAADQIGELRLPGMEDLVFCDTRIVDQIAKQRSVRLVTLRPLRRANEIEIALQRCQCK